MRTRRLLNTGTLALVLFFCLTIGGYGAFNVWKQHSGVADRMTVTECTKGSARSRARNNCFGTVVNKPPSYETSMHIWGARAGDVGHDIDVHIQGHEAVADAWSTPLILIVVSVVVATGVLIFGLRRRPEPVRHAWGGGPPQ